MADDPIFNPPAIHPEPVPEIFPSALPTPHIPQADGKRIQKERRQSLRNQQENAPPSDPSQNPQPSTTRIKLKKSKSKSRSRVQLDHAALDHSTSSASDALHRSTSTKTSMKQRASAFGSVMSIGADEVWDDDGDELGGHGRVRRTRDGTQGSDTARHTETDREGRKRRGRNYGGGRVGRSDEANTRRKHKRPKALQLRCPTTGEIITFRPDGTDTTRDAPSSRDRDVEQSVGSIYGSQMLYTVPEPPTDEEEVEEEEEEVEQQYAKGVEAVYVDEGGRFRRFERNRYRPNEDLEAAMDDPSYLDRKMIRLAR
ncbi:hypothetical protein HK097_001873, partial [Rhizophlyctis rosea]